MRDSHSSPAGDGLDEQFELAGTRRRSSRGALLVRGALYGVALLLTTSLGALAMFPSLVSYADPLLGESAAPGCSMSGCCAAKKTAPSTAAATSTDEVACPGGVCDLPLAPASPIDLAEAAEQTGLSGALSSLAPVESPFSGDADPFARAEEANGE